MLWKVGEFRATNHPVIDRSIFVSKDSRHRSESDRTIAIRLAKPLEEEREAPIAAQVLEERHARNADPAVALGDALVEQRKCTIGVAQPRWGRRWCTRQVTFQASATWMSWRPDAID